MFYHVYVCHITKKQYKDELALMFKVMIARKLAYKETVRTLKTSDDPELLTKLLTRELWEQDKLIEQSFRNIVTTLDNAKTELADSGIRHVQEIESYAEQLMIQYKNK